MDWFNVLELQKLNKKIIECKKCKRQVYFREKIAREKRRQFFDEIYWGKPVIGFGDKNAEILIMGLAPAAHGGNRTGRVFTGDKSADFLFKCLHKAKFSNISTSKHLQDGLILKNIYMTPALKCVPPKDKPTSEELSKCFIYLNKEIQLLPKIKKILTLGQIAFNACLKLYHLKKKDYRFVHGATYKINKELDLIACYHPSPRNVNTKRIDEVKMMNILKKL